ncbi:hypothetical protein Csa_010325 [Cucumis sativus]|uniref:Uncharacterized protein n=1 Tax=Cucumis sativus TaxID=3659 RepID=A0A0A0LAK3_CUCSA|nr:hypothetical protein Csa_010325 [Cucumis sativus]
MTCCRKVPQRRSRKSTHLTSTLQFNSSEGNYSQTPEDDKTTTFYSLIQINQPTNYKEPTFTQTIQKPQALFSTPVMHPDSAVQVRTHPPEPSP